MHMAKSIKAYKKNHIVFSYNKKIQKYILAFIFGFNNQFIKALSVIVRLYNSINVKRFQHILFILG